MIGFRWMVARTSLTEVFGGMRYYPHYVKGAVIAWLLDAKSRHATGGRKSLDDLMRRAYASYSGERGYSLDDFLAISAEMAGQDLRDWFHRTLAAPGARVVWARVQASHDSEERQPAEGMDCKRATMAA